MRGPDRAAALSGPPGGGGEPRRKRVAERAGRAVDVGVGAPAEMPGAVEDVLRAHLEDRVGMRADPRTARRDVAQHGVEHRTRPAVVERIDPHEHAVDREQLVAHLVGESLVEHGRLGVDAGPLQLLEHGAIAIVVRRRRKARRAVAAPDHRDLGCAGHRPAVPRQGQGAAARRRVIERGVETWSRSMRNRLDVRALRRAWTGAV